MARQPLLYPQDMKRPLPNRDGHMSLKFNKHMEATPTAIMLTNLDGMEVVEPMSLVARCAMARQKRRAEALLISEERQRKKEEYGMKEILKPNSSQAEARAGEVRGIPEVGVAEDGVENIKR